MPARRSFGSIRRLPSGRWQARYEDRFGRTHTAPRTFPTKTEAQRFLAGIETDLSRGTWHDERRGRVPFAEWAEQWRSTTVNLRSSSRARDESYLRNLILPTFGRQLVGEIDHLEVRRWVSELSASGRAPATVVKAAQILGKVIRSAVDARMILTSPCDRVPLPRIERAEMRFLEPREIARLATTIDPRYRAAVLVAAYGGLRAGELLGLRRQRVDLTAGRIEVAEIVVEVRGQITIGPPKTRAGQRTVPLPRVVVDALAAHLDASPADETGFVFPAPGGGPVRLGQWRQRFWRPATVTAGLDPLRIHDLRHTAVALWIAAGATPNDIARRAGHASVVTVLDRYGHLLPGLQDKVTDSLDRLAREGQADQ
jgi:integrase